MGSLSPGEVNNLLKVIQKLVEVGFETKEIWLLPRCCVAFMRPKLGGIPLFHGEEERDGVFPLLWSPAFPTLLDTFSPVKSRVGAPYG